MQNQYLKAFIRYSTLNVLGMMGISCYILADTYFVANGLGAQGLAALNLAIPTYSFILGISLMLGMGGATKYTICKSRKEDKLADTTFTNTVFWAAVLAVVFILTGIFFAAPLTRALGAEGEIFVMTKTYMQVLLLFAPALLLNNILLCFVRNDNNPKLAMFAMLGGSIANIILDYIFIFPLQMGMFGAVFATCLAPIISMLILLDHWIKRKNNFHLLKIKPAFKITQEIISLGFPSLVAEVSAGIVMIIFNLILLNLRGNLGVAAYGVIANLSLVVIAVYTGIAQGIQPLFSQAYGLGEKENVRKILSYALVTIISISCLIYFSFYVFADPIVSVFNGENHVQLQGIATSGLKIYFTAIFFAGFNIIIAMFFTSTANPVPAHIISLTRGLFLVVPMVFLLSSFLGTTGVWLAFPVTEGLVAILCAALYFKLAPVYLPGRRLMGSSDNAGVNREV